MYWCTWYNYYALGTVGAEHVITTESLHHTILPVPTHLLCRSKHCDARETIGLQNGENVMHFAGPLKLNDSKL